MKSVHAVAAFGTVPPGAMSLEGCLPPPPFELDQHQAAVRDWREGEAMVSAAAGSGKSTVLVERTVTLFDEGVYPEKALILAYNRDAADSLRRRIAVRAGKYGPALAKRVQIFTFHGFALAALKRAVSHPIFRNLVGISKGIPSQARLFFQIKGQMRKDGHGIATDDWRSMMRFSEYVRDTMAWKGAEHDIEGDDEVAHLASVAYRLGVSEKKVSSHDCVAFLKAYQKTKREIPAIDFADMTWILAQLAENHPDAFSTVAQYQHVMVDEAQDINQTRAIIVDGLCKQAVSRVMVGDLRQSLYGFTGAQPSLFQSRLDAGATLLEIPVNRRSTQAIVNWGNKAVEGAEWVIGAAVPRDSAPDGAEPDVRIYSAVEEAVSVVQEVKKRSETEGLGTRDNEQFAILARTNSRLVSLEVACILAGLPCRVQGREGGIWDSSVGVDVFGYIEILEERIPDANTVFNLARKPNRFASKQALSKGIEIARRHDRPLWFGLDGVGQRGAEWFGRDLRQAADQPFWEDRVDSVRAWFDKWLEEQEEDKKKKPLLGDTDSLAGVYQALCDLAVEAGSMEGMYAQRKRARQLAAQNGAVLLSTVHKAKGLEWPTVYLTGVEDGVLPHKKASDPEEEQRIYYVGCTRAKTELIITCEAPPSPFLQHTRAFKNWLKKQRASKQRAQDDIVAALRMD